MDDESSVQLPAQNVNEWVMPLDQYIPINLHNSDYAENLLVEPCMNARGFSWDVPWQDVKSPATATLNAVGRALFNLHIAQQWGYHPAAVQDPSSAAWHDFAKAHVSLSTAEEAALAHCIDEARGVLPRLPASARVAPGLAQSAFESAQQDSKVKAAATQWRSCMAPAGISDLPAAPTQMPTKSMILKFKLRTNPAPSAHEIKIAVADANCRASSGYVKAAYDAEWSRQAELLRANADTLQAVASEIAKNSAAVIKVIQAHPPKADTFG